MFNSIRTFIGKVQSSYSEMSEICVEIENDYFDLLLQKQCLKFFLI